MNNRLLLEFLLVGILSASPMSSSATAFEYESWPYEGIPYFEVVKDKIELHETASSKSPVIAKINAKKGSVASFAFGVEELIKRHKKYGTIFGIKDGATINSDFVLGKSIQITTKPGVIRATTSGAITGSFYNKGDVIEDLMYLGEGNCLYRYHGIVFDNDTCLFSDLQDGSLVQESRPVTEWWVTVVNNGKTMGWLKIDDDSPFRMIETIR